MNKTAFYTEYNNQFGPLSQAQVDGLGFLLTRLETDKPASLEHAAYLLATTYHETAMTFEPVTEAYWMSEQWRIDNLSYAVYWGRGYVQITWLENYQKAGQKLSLDLTTDPDVVMDPEISYAILLRGCSEGWFTGKKLSDYIAPGKTDYIGARAVVNGSDKASTIAGYAEKMATCLKSAGYSVPVAAPPLVCDMPTIRAPFGNTIATNILVVAFSTNYADLDSDVRAFQANHGLVADGVVGPGTWCAIYQAAIDRRTAAPAPGTTTRRPPNPL